MTALEASAASVEFTAAGSMDYSARHCSFINDWCTSVNYSLVKCTHRARVLVKKRMFKATHPQKRAIRQQASEASFRDQKNQLTINSRYDIKIVTAFFIVCTERRPKNLIRNNPKLLSASFFLSLLFTFTIR